ncbi:MAG TPA: DUF4416 domain-containing protein [Candidatus Latescibacteria bacterium]|jgi:hypothetical protein|nr:DUF4416 domain-containing protein [Candidatus Latescibacterota bacterium]|tara:strand:+ start:86 stop:601 length:516 start_codon:yes stop_codon:yes gene_type:complete
MPLDLNDDRTVAFLCAVMAPGAAATLQAIDELAAEFGDVRLCSPVYDFDMTSYYEAEMGPDLCKALVWLGPLVAPAELAQRKGSTITFERSRANVGRRTVNVDPGLLSANSLVLATTKSSGHRICIAPSLWAEVTLLFEKGAYRPQPWTYRDYQREDVGAFLLSVRGALGS